MIMTFIEEAVIGEFISKVSDSAFDISKVKIKQAVENRKNKHQSPESQMYNIVVDVLNKITYGEYENDQDKIYDAAEKILKGFKSGIGNSEDDIKLGLNDICENVDENKCTDFMKLIYRELSKENYSELYREISLLKGEKESNKTSRIEQKVDVAIQKIDNIGNSNEKVVSQEEKFQSNKKDKYLKIWNGELFLHSIINKRFLALKDVFIMPQYYAYIQINKVIDETYINNFLNNMNGAVENSNKYTIDTEIIKYIKYKETSTMLITGVPGVGKTSIVAWMANKFKDNKDIIILRFRDWEVEELNDRLLKIICNTLRCAKSDLENKVLILDGFDEIKLLNIRESLLYDFFIDILDFENFKIIITSRPNYIEPSGFNYAFEILPFGIDEIKRFYYLIKGFEVKELACNNLDVIGIPVILYMAIMSNIDFSIEATKPDLYNRIFTKRGGIFDKFAYEGRGYDYGSHIMRDKSNIKKYFVFLQDVAFMMFEKNSLLIPRKDCQVPELSFQGYNICILDFPINHLIENTGDCIEFVHKSIYEFFLSEYIFCHIYTAVELKNKDKLSSVLGDLLKKNILSSDILDFLKFRIKGSKINNEYTIINESFQLMLQHGMIFYTGKCPENVIGCEMNVFANMLELLHIWEKNRLEINDLICGYLKINTRLKFNLKNAILVNKNLSRVNLAYSNLSGSHISYCIFKDANLEGIKIDEAILSNLDMRGANLIEVNFINTEIENIMLDNAKIYKTKFSDKQSINLEKKYNIQEDIVIAPNIIKVRHFIRGKRNIFSLDEKCGEVLSQDEIDLLVLAMIKENSVR